MATQGFIVEINSLWIDTLMEQGDAFWYIFCSTEPDTLKAFVPLVLSNDTLYEEATLLLDGTEVTCTGCADGCSPRRKGNGDGYCTNCNTPSVECTKSETLKSGGIFNWAY